MVTLDFLVRELNVVVHHEFPVSKQDSPVVVPGGETEALLVDEILNRRQQFLLAEYGLVEHIGERPAGLDDQCTGVEDGIIDLHVAKCLDSRNVAGTFAKQVRAVQSKGVDACTLVYRTVAKDDRVFLAEPLVLIVEAEVSSQQGKSGNGHGKYRCQNVHARYGAADHDGVNCSNENRADDGDKERQPAVLVRRVVGKGVLHDTLRDLGL